MPTPTPDQLAVAFAALYGAPPTHMARAPGRVNLIGEHIDYAGFAVFPMAIQRQVTITFRPIEEPECRIVSGAPGLESRSFRLDRAIEPYAVGDWGNYVKAAAAGLRERRAVLTGIEALVTSNVPVAAGLSSSSALVVGCALAFLAAADESVPPLELAELMAEAEQFTGTRGAAWIRRSASAPGRARRRSSTSPRFASSRCPFRTIGASWWRTA